MRPPLIGVCGDSEANAPALDGARAVGELLARAGAIVICGGGGGVMGAAADGARSAGGTSLGLLPGWDPDDASEAVTIALPTGLDELRNGLIIRAARAIIAIDGGVGTLTEMALALRLERPVATLGSWELRPRAEAAPDPRVHVADSPEDAVRCVLAAVGR